MARWRQMEILGHFLDTQCQRLPRGVPEHALLRWCVTQKLFERTQDGSDPVIPSPRDSVEDPGLLYELEKAGLPLRDAQQLGADLALQAKASLRELHAVQSANQTCGPVVLAEALQAVKLSCGSRTVLIAPQYWHKLIQTYHSLTIDQGLSVPGGEPMAKPEELLGIVRTGEKRKRGESPEKEHTETVRKKVRTQQSQQETETRNKQREEKAEQEQEAEEDEEKEERDKRVGEKEDTEPKAETEIGQQDTKVNEVSQELAKRAFCLLARYEMQGGEGYQAALPLPVFDFLTGAPLYVTHECFASPLNRTLASFTSAYPDVDMPFGSRGNFFQLRQLFGSTGGSFEANPPFMEEIMLAMALYFEHWMQDEQVKEDGGVPLSVTVFVPGWDDTPAYDVMQQSPFRKVMLVLEKDKHGYRPGFQHKPGSQRSISYATTFVFVLQNRNGALQWPLPPSPLDLRDRLLSAFHSS
eukprot:TRINITY_DN4561_c0_g1_i1.p1 TRINITY_DN4561_c0_g1~~TRINITY_DN4561_c0_g1_i1.p1  ORF type:complete len:469 (-),score=76.27 TRINITY_DN4561_c0_g1_i1:227-1633(-)